MNKILRPTTQRVLYLNAGHWDDPRTPSYIEDSGTHSDSFTEFIEAIRVRDALIPLCEQSYIWVEKTPDSLDLTQSIAWVNQRSTGIDSGLALDIHFNSNPSLEVGGTEAYYGWSGRSKQIAESLSRNVAGALGVRNRGAKPDAQTAVGSLGWLRKTTPWAGLVEVCYFTNKQDKEAYYKHGPQAVAEGIHYALLEVFGTPTVLEKVAYNYKRFKNT